MLGLTANTLAALAAVAMLVTGLAHVFNQVAAHVGHLHLVMHP